MLRKFIFASCLFIMAAGVNAADNSAKNNPANDDVEALCWTGDQITGPIWSNVHAQQVCPSVCSNIGGAWTGNWVTVIWGQRSVCNCRVC